MLLKRIRNVSSNWNQGYHVFKDIWSPRLGEDLELHCEPETSVDKHSVCLKTKDGKKVGKNQDVSQRQHFTFYKVTLKQVVQPKYLGKYNVKNFENISQFRRIYYLEFVITKYFVLQDKNFRFAKSRVHSIRGSLYRKDL